MYQQIAQMNADSPVPTQGVAGRDKLPFLRCDRITMERPVGAGHVPPTSRLSFPRTRESMEKVKVLPLTHGAPLSRG